MKDLQSIRNHLDKEFSAFSLLFTFPLWVTCTYGLKSLLSKPNERLEVLGCRKRAKLRRGAILYFPRDAKIDILSRGWKSQGQALGLPS